MQAGGAQQGGFDPNAHQQGGYDAGAGQSQDGTFYSADYEDNSDK